MSAPINQIQSPDDEDEDQTEETHDLVHHSENKDSAIKVAVQEPFLSYYNHDFEQAKDFPGAVSTASTPLKISYNTLIKEGFDLASQKMKPKKRTAEVVDGGRVVRATGRKDRHSKVRTASGPRDRRVRLSPRTAIQFYDVQDRLGYDRPSKAIDWLINEAKNAIDALEEQPILKFSEPNVVEIHSPWIPNHKQEQDDSLVSGFSCFANEAAALEAYLDQDFNSSRNTCEIICPNSHGFCSALNVEANWEMAALQKMFSWNRGNESIRGGGGGGAEYSSGNTLPVAQPISGHVNLFSQREPLQSSVINYSPMNNDVSGFNFSNELSKIAASATIKQGENSKKLI